MPEPNFILLYIDSPAASAAFYSGLLSRQPIEQSPTFAMFALDSGVMLGLWSRHTVEPKSTAPGGGEVGFSVPDVDAVYADWQKRGLPFIQPITDMDFGRTFVATDPDGHRLRVFTPGPQ